AGNVEPRAPSPGVMDVMFGVPGSIVKPLKALETPLGVVTVTLRMPASAVGEIESEAGMLVLPAPPMMLDFKPSALNVTRDALLKLRPLTVIGREAPCVPDVGVREVTKGRFVGLTVNPLNEAETLSCVTTVIVRKPAGASGAIVIAIGRLVS